MLFIKDENTLFFIAFFIWRSIIGGKSPNAYIWPCGWGNEVPTKSPRFSNGKTYEIFVSAMIFSNLSLKAFNNKLIFEMDKSANEPDGFGV